MQTGKDYFKGFRYFHKGIKAASQEMWISLEVLVALTAILSIPLYFVEHAAQPDVYSSFWDSLVWSFMAYLGNPGKFAPGDPITYSGRILWILISLLKIALFAIPAGLIANGFRSAMAEEARENQLKKFTEKLHKSFNRKQSGDTLYRTVPKFVPVTTIQAKQGIDTKDILDAVAYGNNFRLRNLAGCQSITEHPEDRLVVELFPKNMSYGCCIDRGSDITIVSPSSVSEAGIGNFSYYVAKFGGFNYVSREIDLNPDEPFSYYNIQSEDGDQNLPAFLSDIRSLQISKKSWVIFLISDMANEPQFHFLHGARKGDLSYDDPNITVKDVAIYDSALKNLAAKLKEVYGLSSAIQDKAGSSKMYIGRHVGKDGVETNAFTIRVSYKVTVWNGKTTAIAADIASSLKASLDPTHPFVEDPEWKSHGYGYGV